VDLEEMVMETGNQRRMSIEEIEDLRSDSEEQDLVKNFAVKRSSQMYQEKSGSGQVYQDCCGGQVYQEIGNNGPRYEENDHQNQAPFCHSSSRSISSLSSHYQHQSEERERGCQERDRGCHERERVQEAGKC